VVLGGIRGRVCGIARLGKYLLIDFSTGRVLLAHLGMSGRIVIVPRSTAREPHTHAVLRLDSGDDLRYVDPRRFGALAVYPRGAVRASDELRALGPDPLGGGFTPAYLAGALAATRGVAVKSFLLDQRRIAGLGNIYASEVLWVARIAPRRRANQVRGDEVARLHRAVVDVLSAAVARRGTTLRDYVDAGGEGGENQEFLAVYDRAGEPCGECGARVRRIVQGARSTFYCPRCQRR
jgi:formamidopyrimidine-DNA glycosylase